MVFLGFVLVRVTCIVWIVVVVYVFLFFCLSFFYYFFLLMYAFKFACTVGGLRLFIYCVVVKVISFP